MKTRTWPYGTTRKGTVIISLFRNPSPIPKQMVKDDLNEAHVLVGDACDKTAVGGDTGTLTFTQGGPTGGYWKFTKDKI